MLIGLEAIILFQYEQMIGLEQSSLVLLVEILEIT